MLPAGQVHDAGHGGFGGGDGTTGDFSGDILPTGGGGAAFGGAIFSYGGDVTIRNSTFTANSLERGEGGTQRDCDNCVHHNGTDAGGAVFAVNGYLKIYNSTIAGNHVSGTAANAGGGVYFLQMPDVPGPIEPPTFVLDNDIIANNGTNECVMKVSASTLSGEFAGNLIQSNDSANPCPSKGIVSSQDPQLASALQDNGGYTPTLAISSGSPAYGFADAGTSLSADQRGQKRPSKDGHGYDIGAFEACDGGADALLCLVPKITEGTEARKLRVLESPTVYAGITEPIPNPPPLEAYLENQGSVLFINATPNPGYYFLNWAGGVLNDPTSPYNSVLMDQDRTLTASFQLHDFSLIADPTSLTIPLGGSASSTVAVSSLGDFGDKVNLSLSTAPAGVHVSVNPNSVTPSPGNPPATSSLTFTLGASVTPQAFGERVTGSTSGIAGAFTHSAQVSVTVVATAAAVVNVITQDQQLGCIDNSGIGQSLTAKLNAYQTLASGRQTQAANNVLAAFQNEVQAQTGQHIATTCTDPAGGNQFYTGQTLLTDSQSLQATLGTQVKANPIVGTVLSSGNVGIAGATVNLLSSSKTVLASTTTDAMGFYYFAGTAGLTPGANYTVKVTPPKLYKSATSATFNWQGTAVTVPNLVLN